MQQPRAGAPAPHGHGGIHESPEVMLAPLVILAVLSICGGWIGSERFDKFLSPVFHAGMTRSVRTAEAAVDSRAGTQKEDCV